MYIPNVYTKNCYPMYIHALKCIYPMYIDVTQCITPNVYTRQYTLGIYIVLRFLATSYIHWVTVYTLGCMLVFVTFCYPMYIPYIHWDTKIYIGAHDIHWMTLIYIGYIHCVTMTTHISIG